MVRVLSLKCGDPVFKTGSDQLFNLILVVPGSTSRPQLQITNWPTSDQSRILRAVLSIVIAHTRYSPFPWVLLTNTRIFLRGLHTKEIRN